MSPRDKRQVTKNQTMVRFKGIDGVCRVETLCSVLNRLAVKRAATNGKAGQEMDDLVSQLETIEVGCEAGTGTTPDNGGNDMEMAS